MSTTEIALPLDAASDSGENSLTEVRRIFPGVELIDKLTRILVSEDAGRLAQQMSRVSQFVSEARLVAGDAANDPDHQKAA